MTARQFRRCVGESQKAKAKSKFECVRYYRHVGCVGVCLYKFFFVFRLVKNDQVFVERAA